MKKVLCISLVISGMLIVIITDVSSLIGNLKSCVLLESVESLANDESYERWDNMELITYRCEDGHRSGKACELSWGNITCSLSEEEYCTEEGDNKPDLNRCPAGGFHDWKLYFIKGQSVIKCRKCEMER